MIAKVPTKDPAESAESTLSSLKEQTLKASGWSLIAGDLALVFANHLEGEKHGFQGAALWLAGGAAAGFFGNPKAEKKLQLMERRLGGYLKKQGVKIPDNPTTAELSKDGGVIAHIESFLYSHPSELLSAAFAIGGGLMLKSDSSETRKSGALVLAGALAGLLIPEKPPNPEHPARGLGAKAWEYIQEKPLRVSSAFYTANDYFIWKKAEIHRKEPGNKSYIARYVTLAAYLLGNALMWFSSKENLGAKEESNNRKLYEGLAQVSAQVVAAQPQQLQEALVQHIAGYLSAQPEIKKTAPEIAALLHAKLGEVKPSLPVAGKWESRMQKGAEPQLSPSV
jgi:hypothetical protein